ncbi:N-acetyllactosaminide beta-1,3-N-acetylglucosaminyltransferase 3 [Rhynchocyon petersi]
MRWLRPLGSTVGLALALVLGASTLLLLFGLPLSPPTCFIPKEPPTTPMTMVAWPSLAQVPRRPLCQANATAATQPGFIGQPQHVRNFLLYKHCRDFPLLQDAPPSKCEQPVFLLLVIKSSPANYERREMVRRTWGQERLVQGAQVRRLFLVGTDPKELEAVKVNRLLELEARAHGDILQWDFHDTFFNLTLKQVLFLRWHKTRCHNASFLFNGDDDVFTHTDNVVAFLQGKDPSRHLFVGHLIQNVGPIRIPWSKYYVPKVITENESYPPYCGGGGFLLSCFTAAALHRAAHALDLFPIDDVYLGMCLEHQGLKPSRHSGIHTGGVSAPSPRLSSFDPCFFRELLVVHRFLPYEMLLMWDALNLPNLVCGKKTKVY